MSPILINQTLSGINRGRILLIAMSLLVGIVSTPTSAVCQNDRSSAQVKEIMSAFCMMGAKGAQLSPAGWRNMTVLLARPQKQPTRVVVVREFEVGEPGVTDQHATVYVEYIDLGEIDTSGRLYLASKSPRSGPIKVRSEYKLSRVSKQTGAVKTKDSATEAAWKIDGEEVRTFITVETAIEYLSNLKDSTDDKNTKKRAARAVEYFRRTSQITDYQTPQDKSPITNHKLECRYAPLRHFPGDHHALLS